MCEILSGGVCLASAKWFNMAYPSLGAVLPGLVVLLALLALLGREVFCHILVCLEDVQRLILISSFQNPIDRH